jgi:hypothetical protein
MHGQKQTSGSEGSDHSVPSLSGEQPIHKHLDRSGFERHNPLPY